MGGKLLIVEAPKKAKTISRFFSGLTVKATVGHVVDLPVKEMGVEPPDHKPHYETIAGKDKVIAGLRGAANSADTIYIATDLDREGEAIAAHVKNLLGKKHEKKISRVTYTEVNRSAIDKAMRSPHSIRWPLVRAQKARRVVDRYVGYSVSKLLTQKIKSALSLPGLSRLTAGRVQSIALKLIVLRQREIEAFKPVTYYGVRAIVHHSNNSGSFTANWVPRDNDRNDDGLVVDVSVARQVKEQTKELRHTKSEIKRAAVLPPKPLTTSVFIQFCAGKLKLTTKLAMASAQRLYEQGLITYHRTDSPTMSSEAIEAVREYATKNNLPVPSKPPSYNAKANAQEAHECLRVSDINLESPENLESQDQSVYRLIWEVTLLSQLAKGFDDRQTVNFVNGNEELFVARGRKVIELGWRSFASKYFNQSSSKKSQKDDDAEQVLPVIKEGAVFSDLSVSLLEKKTEPPAVLTEKTLVQMMDKQGIGRPSTYAQTIEKIVSMNYVERQAKTLKFIPTSLGYVVVDALEPYFKFMSVDYTVTLEAEFDRIAEGKNDYLSVVDAAYQQLQKEMEAFEKGDIKTKVKPDDLASFCYSKKTSSRGKSSSKKTSSQSGNYKDGDQCPECSKGTIQIRHFKKGANTGKPFLGCNQFPDCKFFAWPSSTQKQAN
ncbi:hypothetical protein AB835_08070 [Candidatus Endobugula sertula]|uniref:DNA topoisomerase n=1 Tax=Candidatus Endobugula sertula TaxID=62101 RepID=A0A1D2QPP4_9GAMM|nr:hypothetical protein AB835_08070 [Candidatus Endobugula sertula]